MSHIFISYSHHDVKHRDALITGLQKEGIDYWADIGLQVGEAWREQIDSSLEEAFALALIVTNNSLQSPYVTYEWSWALGHEIPVLPLFFEEITVPIHTRLNAIHQQHKCYMEIPQEVFEIIKRHQTQSPLVAYIELHISEFMLPLRYVIRTLTWLCSYDESTFELENAMTSIYTLLMLEFRELNRNKLPQLWLQNSHSFPREQKRKFQQLTEQVETITSYIPLPISNSRNLEITFINLWKEKIERVLHQFMGYDNYFYAKFDQDLENITMSGLPIYDATTRTKIGIMVYKLQVNFYDKLSQELREVFVTLSREPISESDFGSGDDDDPDYDQEGR